MAKLSVSNFISLNGFYKGANEDISWNKQREEEEHQYAVESLKKDDILLFGRKTYELMVSYWTSKMALESDPMVAERMNNSDKMVFSNKLETVGWNKTKLIKGNIVEETKKIKKDSENDITILGSGTIVTQLADAGLIDKYELIVYPLVLGEGTPLFNGIKSKLELKLIEMKTFKSGTVIYIYEPTKNR